MAAAQHGALHPARRRHHPVIVALLIPRLLILFWIYSDQGISIWFLIHVIALLCAWGGGGSRVYPAAASPTSTKPRPNLANLLAH